MNRRRQLDRLRPKSADTAANVFLRRPTQIFRAVHPAIEYNHLRDYLFCDALTGDFGSGLKATSVGDCGSFGPFAGN
jgi:hypothetical protein